MAAASTLACKLVEAELDRLPRAERELSAEARRHIQECECCLSLYTWLSEPDPGIAISPQLRERIAHALTSSLPPISPISSPLVRIVQFLCAFAVVAVAAIAILGVPGLLNMNVWQAASFGAILAAGAALLCVSLAWQTAPGSLQRFSARAVIALLGAGFLIASGLLFEWKAPKVFLAQGWHCSATGIAVAALASALLWMLARRGATVRPITLGGTIGAVGGLAGVTVLEFACARHEALHQAVWHGAVLLVSVGVGVLAAYLLDRTSKN